MSIVVNGYPTAYRNASVARAAAGFQSSRAVALASRVAPRLPSLSRVASAMGRIPPGLNRGAPGIAIGLAALVLQQLYEKWTESAGPVATPVNIPAGFSLCAGGSYCTDWADASIGYYGLNRCFQPCTDQHTMTDATWNTFNSQVGIQFGTTYVFTLYYKVDVPATGYHRAYKTATFTAPVAGGFPGQPTMPSTAPVRYIPIAPSLRFAALDPMSLPIGQPVGVSRPIPWALIPHLRPNPYRSPTEQTVRGNYAPGGRSLPQTATPPSLPQIEVSRREVVQRPSAYVASPPAPGVKERKFIATINGTAIGVALNAFTESLDFVYAIYDALPWYARTTRSVIRGGRGRAHILKRPPIWEALERIYEHYDVLDMDKALGNLIRSNAVDVIFGAYGVAAGRVSRDIGLPIGIQTYLSRFGVQS